MKSLTATFEFLSSIDYIAMLVCYTGTQAVSKPGAGEFFLMSALAKLGATILTYPILLVKSRLMAASKHTHADLQYNGTYDALKSIYKKEGMFSCYSSTALCTDLG